MGWKETRDALRRALERGSEEWDRVRAGHGVLTPIATPHELTHHLVDARGWDWRGRRAIAGALLSAHHERSSSFLSTALILAYWPLLSSLSGRAPSSFDREQIALASFVNALAESHPGRGIDSLAWRTRRHFFRALRVEATPRHERFFDVEDTSVTAEETVVLREALRTIEERHGVTALALLGEEPLAHLAARMKPDARPRARRRAALTLYKRRERVLASLRDELNQISA